MILRMISILTLLLTALPVGAQDNGTWLELDAEETPAASDSIRLGETDYLDHGQPDNPTNDVDVSSPRTSWMSPSLDFRRSRLQDLLRENMLLEEENISKVEIFRSESSMALELYQLRGEEWPHYHPMSDLWVYIWRGRGDLSLDDGVSEYGPGDFLQIPAGNTYALRNLSGAPTVAIIWQWPPVVDSLTVEFIPEDVLMQMELDSLRAQDLEDRSLYKKR